MNASWNELIFNWHPILMTSGFILAFIWAALSFRIFQFGKPTNKILHSLLHTGAIVCFSVGLYAVFEGNNNTEKNTSHTYYPNLYSIHSWMGISAIGLYCLNYLLAGLTFYGGVFGDRGKAYFIHHHMTLGIILVVMVGIVAESGLSDLSTPLCAQSYTVTTPDYNPIEHFKDLSSGCKTANTAGIFILLTIILTVYALVDMRPQSTASSQSQPDNELQRLLL